MSADFSVIGSGATIYNPSGADSFAQSAEPGNFATLVTRSMSPLGLAGDCVFRRLYLTLEHHSGIALAVVPVVDGERITECARYFSRPAPPAASAKERWTFMVPMGITMLDRPGTVGVRGTTIQLEIAAHNPEGDWYLERMEVVYAPGSRARRED